MRKLLIAMVLVSGCAAQTQPANSIRPIIDVALNPEGRNMESDLLECNVYANNVAGVGASAMNGGVGGAALGAAGGALLGWAMGVNPGSTAAIGAASGGVTGAASGAASSVMTKRQVVSKCMAGRGYSVLR